jgi:hypothetical protein
MAASRVDGIDCGDLSIALSGVPPPLSGCPLSTNAMKGSGVFKRGDSKLHLSSLEPETRDYFVGAL